MTNKSESKQPENQVRVGFTHGDVNGIGYEIIIKTLMDKRIMDMITPVVFGHSKVASYHRKTINAKDFNFNLIKRVDAANPKRPNIYNIDDREVKIELGIPTKIGGEMAYLSLKSAVESIELEEIDAIVTAPINKKSIQSDDFKSPGHTEYLAERHHVTDYLMMMVSNNLRIGVITGHIPLREVPDAVNQDLVMNKIQIMHDSLRRDFAIARPRIAVLGLNPHAGDDGLLGGEEKETIIPVINKAFDDGIMVYGPYPADGFFAAGQHNKFDGVLAMYHDQGLIPFKTLAFDSGVNYTAGLPIVRTSPAHGTAYDIAGKNQASESSMRAAVYMACDIFRNRRDFDEMNADPLITDEDDEDDNHNHTN